MDARCLGTVADPFTIAGELGSTLPGACFSPRQWDLALKGGTGCCRRSCQVIFDVSAIDRPSGGDATRQRQQWSERVRRLCPNLPVAVYKAFTDRRKNVKDFHSTRPPNDVIAIGPIERLSVILTVEPRAPQPWAQLIAWLYERRNRIGIVYAPNGSTGLILADRLSAIGLEAKVLSGQEKPITVLTSGRRGEYGSRELDFIVHMFPPASLEDFRDDLRAAGGSRIVTTSVVFHQPDDASRRDNPYGGEPIGGASRPPDLDSVMAFLQTKTCRHQFLIRHFASASPAPRDTEVPCDRCDNCLGRRYYPGDDVRSAPT
jgi:hypothetical protein